MGSSALTAPGSPTRSAGEAMTVKLPGGVRMSFCWIPAGEFWMGSTESEQIWTVCEGAKSDWVGAESPRHLVRITEGLWLAKHQVTNRQFRAFRPNHDSKEYDNLTFNDDEQPAVYVSWKDALSFCAWLTQNAEGTYRLPSEAEWEYACRAGTQTWRWWGDDANNCEAGLYANVADRAAQRVWPDGLLSFFNCDGGHAVTAPVGSFRPNAWGLHDMLGNVWEWCGDWYGEDYYAKSPKENPVNNTQNKYRVLRGGSWFLIPRNIRCAARHRLAPQYSDVDLGFRPAMILPRFDFETRVR